MEYALTLEDFGAFRKTVQQKVGRQSNLLPLIALVFVVVSSIVWINTQQGEVSIFQVLGMGLVVVTTFFLYRRHVSGKARECEADQFAKTSLGEPVSVRMDDQSMIIERKHHQSIWEWDAFEGITTEGDTIYLWYSELEALIIPNRAFSDNTEREEVLRDLQSRISPNVS